MFVLFGFVSGLQAQNLLYNGSFEDCNRCPDEPGALTLCNYWTNPNIASPDLFKKCQHSLSYFDVPENICGIQEPRSGSAYAGIVLISGIEEIRNYREYIQGELKEALEANTWYNISFYVNWAEHSNYFCDRIGYLFSPKKLTPKEKEEGSPGIGKKKNQVKILESPLRNTILHSGNGYVPLNLDTLRDQDSWHKVEFSYQAEGGEEYMILGLFGDNATEEDYQRYIGKVYGTLIRLNQKAYIYIDDVYVEKTDFTHH